MRAFCTYSLIFLVKYSLIILLILKSGRVTGNRESIRSVDVKKTKIWGPGLEPDKIILPVRHFYIQPIDAYGNS